MFKGMDGFLYNFHSFQKLQLTLLGIKTTSPIFRTASLTLWENSPTLQTTCSQSCFFSPYRLADGTISLCLASPSIGHSESVFQIFLLIKIFDCHFDFVFNSLTDKVWVSLCSTYFRLEFRRLNILKVSATPIPMCRIHNMNIRSNTRIIQSTKMITDMNNKYCQILGMPCLSSGQTVKLWGYFFVLSLFFLSNTHFEFYS
jgi:hypothetical protein